MNRFVRTSWILVGILACAKGTAGEITVSAAISLSGAFTQIARDFEASAPSTRVALNFGASGALLQQIIQGAPVDVFASADQETMDLAEKRDLVRIGERHNLASNSLVVVVPHDSTLGLNTLADLGLPSVRRVAIGAPASVPVGRYSQLALEQAQLWAEMAPKMIRTQNVRQSLDYVARAEVDAGFVYRTDALLMPDRVRVAFAVALQQPIRYPIAVLAGAAYPEEAKQFVAFVRSPKGQATLANFGFGKP